METEVLIFLSTSVFVCGWLFLCGKQETVGGAVYGTILFEDFLGFQQLVKAGVHRKSRKLPLDNPRKPDQRAGVEKTDRTIGFFGAEDGKACGTEKCALGGQVVAGKRLRRSREKKLCQLPVVVLPGLLPIFKTAPSSYLVCFGLWSTPCT